MEFIFFKSSIKKLLLKMKIGFLLPWYKELRIGQVREKKIKIARNFLLEDKNIPKSSKILLEKVSTVISSKDNMYVNNGSVHYLSVGLSAIDCIVVSLENSNIAIKSIEKILDFPSGYGRVLRFLKVKFPAAQIYSSELIQEANIFCSRKLGSKIFNSNKDLSKVNVLEKFDLIWCGSLITHLNEKDIFELIRFFCSVLNESGLLIFTTHGQFSYNLLSSGSNSYGIQNSKIPIILNEFETRGFGFSSYIDEIDYGISIVTFKKMNEIISLFPNLIITSFLEKSWDNHQDVFAVKKIHIR